MGWTYRRTWSLGRLFRVTLGRRGLSLSAGFGRLRATAGPSGKQVSVSPGAGFRWTSRRGKRSP